MMKGQSWRRRKGMMIPWINVERVYSIGDERCEDTIHKSHSYKFYPIDGVF